MLNLTPHDITIQAEDGTAITIPPSGAVARVDMTEITVGYAVIDGNKQVPLITRIACGITGLDEYGTGVAIVSSMVLDYLQSTRDRRYALYVIYAPDTGDTAIRNGKGHVEAVTRLVGMAE